VYFFCLFIKNLLHLFIYSIFTVTNSCIHLLNINTNTIHLFVCSFNHPSSIHSFLYPYIYYITSITSHHTTSQCITSHHTTSHHITLYHITSHHITPHHTTSHPSHHITLYHIMPTSHHITLYHITSHLITLYHTTSHHIRHISHNISHITTYIFSYSFLPFIHLFIYF